jgi:hypothetical protein
VVGPLAQLVVVAVFASVVCRDLAEENVTRRSRVKSCQRVRNRAVS